MYALQDKIFAVQDSSFDELAYNVFQFQYERVKTFRTFCDMLGKQPSSISRITDFPFLPIDFFKHQPVICEGMTAQITFESSGTTGLNTSKHEVADVSIYERSFLTAFRTFYGDPDQFVILALLPSYLERNNSSLVYMVEKLMNFSARAENGFYLNDFEKLKEQLHQLQIKKQKTILIGVSFALLDAAEKASVLFPDLIIIETGGMKGRREEITRTELHEVLKKSFGVSKIHSEYGMTELLSQAYSSGDGIFHSPPWMKIFIRDPDDPIHVHNYEKTGAINIIDLANLYSCSFIATGDAGKLFMDGSFEISGRLGAAEIRGCNLLVS